MWCCVREDEFVYILIHKLCISRRKWSENQSAWRQFDYICKSKCVRQHTESSSAGLEKHLVKSVFSTHKQRGKKDVCSVKSQFLTSHVVSSLTASEPRGSFPATARPAQCNGLHQPRSQPAGTHRYRRGCQRRHWETAGLAHWVHSAVEGERLLEWGTGMGGFLKNGYVDHSSDLTLW